MTTPLHPNPALTYKLQWTAALPELLELNGHSQFMVANTINLTKSRIT